MPHFYFLNNIDLFIKRHKFLSISFLVIIVLIPVLVFAINSRLDGYRVPANQIKYDVAYTGSSGAVVVPMVAIQSSASYDYFVPTKTLNEWTAFYNKAPSLLLSVLNYCGGGACESGATPPETCTNCASDCCPTGTCTSWQYSDWSGCNSNYFQTRQIYAQIPDGCTGGNPVVTNNTIGCDAGTYCANLYVYSSSSDCTGPGGIYPNSPYCANNTYQSGVCQPDQLLLPGPSNYSYKYISDPSGACNNACVGSTSGCATGYVCRNVAAYYSPNPIGTCSGTSRYFASICMPSSYSVGCQLNFYGQASMYISEGTGCTYY